MKTIFSVIALMAFTLLPAVAQDDAGRDWQTDYDAFRQKLVDGSKFQARADEQFGVRWTLTYLGARKTRDTDGDDSYVVYFDTGRLISKRADEYQLIFECSEAQFETWKQQTKGTPVSFTATWSHFFLRIPNKPIKTWFRNTEVAKAE